MLSKNSIVLVVLLLLGVSCVNTGFNVNETGLEYKFIEEHNDNLQPQYGDVVTLKMRYTDPKGNTLEESAAFRIQLNKPSHVGGSIEDALALMHKGDSALFKINAFDYYTKSRRISTPEGLTSEDKLVFYIRLVDVTPLRDFAKEREIARRSNEREEETLLKDFLKRSDVQVEPTLGGLYIVEMKKGMGAAPTPGKKVTVHYLGYFIDGKVFDSSYDRNKAFVFNYGVGEVIQGWDEGLSQMKIGGKYKLVIPSHLAYGDVKRGPIPPNSTLVFEMELLDAEK
jgi:FKBP-type peptidyl-prolyl cis-trans isomerase